MALPLTLATLSLAAVPGPGTTMYLYQSTSILNPTSLALPPSRPSFNPHPRISCNHSSGARDRVVDFGKYKGRMLGTLPSSYLRWVSNNLRAGDFEHWAGLADQVLRDPVYNDRIEWEFAEAVLDGRVPGRDEDGGAVDKLLEISERFGWDYEDKAAWSRVDFGLLGTSRGGRIPTVGDGSRTDARVGNRGGGAGEKVVAGIDERRKGRRERAMMKMKKETGVAATAGTTGRRDGGGGDKIGNGRNRGVEDEDEVEGDGKSDNDNDNVYNPFPGREALLRKVVNARRR